MTQRSVTRRASVLIRRGFFVSALAAASLARSESLSDWSTILSFRPDPALQGKVQNRKSDPDAGPWSIQKVERSRGELLLQSIALVVTKLPAFNGKVADSRALLSHVRNHLSDFFDPALGAYGPVSADDQTALNAPSPAGAMIHVSYKTVGGPGKDAAYLVGEATADHVTWTSLQSGKSGMGNNPYSGNRELGVETALPMDGCILYTRAALRAAEAGTPEEEKALATQSQVLWLSVFQNIRAFIEVNGGQVVDGLVPPVNTLVKWNDVAKSLHQPKIPWQDMDGLWQSTDKEKRFAIQFHGLGSPAEFIERNNKGKELRVAVNIKVATAPAVKGGGTITSYVIERPNDDKEVLNFLSFNNLLQGDIIAGKPLPSRLVLTRSGDKLKGEWFGISVSRATNGRLGSMKQPGTSKAHLYEFKPEGL